MSDDRITAEQPKPVVGMGSETTVKGVSDYNDKEWSSGLFDCFSDLSTCVLSCFCPCVTYAKNKQQMNATDSIGPDVALYCCGIDCFLCGSLACLGASARGDLRNKRKIEGSFISDCLSHYFCYSCSLTQEKRELEAVKKE